MSRLPQALALLLSAAVVAVLASFWVQRAGHPFDLEWMEGGMLVHAWRLMHGLPLYPEPSAEWIPFIYPAGYASVLAALGEVFGLSYPLGRLVSLAGTVAAAGAIVRAVWVHAGSWAWGLAGGAIFLGCYEFTGAFYDLVRLDGLNVGLLAWSVVLGAERRRGSVEAAGLLLAAAFVVKQHVALFGLPMLAGIWLRDGRAAAVRFALFAAVPALLVTAWIEVATGGRYLAYLLGVPASHGLVGPRIFPGTARELAYPLWPALVVVVVGLAARLPRGVVALAAAAGLAAALVDLAIGEVSGIRQVPAWLRAPGVGLVFACVVMGVARLRRPSWAVAYGLGVGAVALLSSTLMRGHVGGFLNVHVQLYWAVALGAALLASRPWPGLAVALQLAWLLAHLLRGDGLLPRPTDREAGARVVAELREAPAPVWSPVAPWLAVQAGHAPSFHVMALWDVAHPGSPFPGAVPAVEEAVAAHRWGTVVVGQRGLQYGLDEHYPRGETLPLGRDDLRPRTGWRERPAALRHPERP